METFRGYVMRDELDSNDHMNVQYYTKKFDLASGQFLARIGFDYQDSMDNLGFAYVESTIKYIKEVKGDSPIHITSEIHEVARKVVTIQHTMWHSLNETLHSECLMKWVLFDMATRKSIELPEELSEALKSHIKQ